MIGIGEALITLAVINFIWNTRPELIYIAPNQDSAQVTINQDDE
jgi:hypothetical protein